MNRRTPNRIALGPLLAAICLAGAPAAAQLLPGERLTNGTFDGGTVAPWSTSFLTSTLTWDGLDLDSCAGTGSGLVTHNDDAAQTVFFDQCVTPIDDQATYDFGAWIRFDQSATTSGTAYVVVYWYGNGTGCSGAYSTDSSSTIVSTAGPEQWYLSVAREVAPPAGADSVRVRLLVRKGTGNPSTPLLARFDDLFFVESGPFWADGFERGSTCRWGP